MVRFCFSLFLCLIVGTVFADDVPTVDVLKCHCTACEESQNNTCITDGLCYTEPIYKTEGVEYAYGCMSKAQFLPPEEIPFLCRDKKLGFQCCFEDYCNREIQPSHNMPTKSVAGLKCHCTVCEESQNNTCITDGLCYTEVHWKNGNVEYKYGCMDKSRYLPPEDIPFVCRDQKFGVQCCFRDYCNREQLPSYIRGRNKCKKDSDCSSLQNCQRINGYLACRDACGATECGPNAKCSVINHRPNCKCLPDYEGDPFDLQNGCKNPGHAILSASVCPDDAKCSIACEEQLGFKTEGRCVGQGREICSCEPSFHATEPPVEPCDEQKCKEKCLSNRVPMIGICTRNGICKCVLHSKES